MKISDLIDREDRVPLDELLHALPGRSNAIPDVVRRAAAVLEGIEVPDNPQRDAVQPGDHRRRDRRPGRKHQAWKWYLGVGRPIRGAWAMRIEALKRALRW